MDAFKAYWRTVLVVTLAMIAPATATVPSYPQSSMIEAIKDNSGTGPIAAMAPRAGSAANRSLSAFARSSGRMVAATGRTV